MEYRWDDFSLDRDGALLTRQGRQVKVSRKVLDCVAHLLEHRGRVVGYDELIRAIWGHDNVTNHQLAQVVLAARRALGDDGHTQRLIRTLPGLGYRWVGALHDASASRASPPASVNDAMRPLAPSASAVDDDPRLPQSFEPDAPPLHERSDAAANDVEVAAEAFGAHAYDRPALEPPTSAEPVDGPNARRAVSSTFREVRRRARAVAWVAALAPIAFIAVWWLQRSAPAVSAQPSATMTAASNPLASIQEKYWRGDVEGVRDGLATLPAALAESSEARALEIQLEIDRGRFERAARKLAAEQAKSEAAGDIVRQAKWLCLRSSIAKESGQPAPEVLAPGQRAVALLESIGAQAPPSAMGEALSARGTGHLHAGEFELAVRDLVRARDLLLKDGDKRRATTARRMLAHTWFRMGRLTDALDELNRTIEDTERLHDANGEAAARLVATRLQIELLRWDDALENSRRNMEITKRVLDSPSRVAAARQYALVLTNFGRLREARSLLEETTREANGPTPSVAFAMYHLASGEADRALGDAAALFDALGPDSHSNMMLMSREGGLLLWTTAAQTSVERRNRPLPAPSSAQVAALQRPLSTPGRIARGRWLGSRGLRAEAEAELRAAFERARREGRLFHMTLAAEPLVDLLLKSQRIDDADAVLASLRGTHPDRMDRDYRVNVLRLRTALAKGDVAEIEEAHRKALALAGERTIPAASRSSASSLAGESEPGLRTVMNSSR
ncbi:MAG: hypothetical protein E6Q50_03765 [Lysobacter sp.]|nr:MAG: hypothetical protein E6Q50_03765 [Lysobacter sp.]